MIGELTVLKDKTLSDLNIDIDTLPSGSHTKIFVECNKCHEIFLREFRHTPLGSNSYKHRCSIYKIENSIQKKWCSKCQNYLEYDKFYKKKNNELFPYCSECNRSRLNNFDNWLKALLDRKQRECKNKNIDFNLTFDYLKHLWDNQHGMCAYTLIPLTFHNTDLASAWLERINPSNGYTIGNVIWSSKGINCLKNNSSFQEFQQYLSNINIKHITPTRLECKIIHKDGKLPFRKRVTDAGYDLFSIEDCVIPSHGMKDVRTGIIIAAPPGYYITVEGRSGMARQGVMPFRGIIDATYCGEMMVALMNISNQDYHVKKHDRIAQIILHEQIHADFSFVEEFGPDYNQRGTSGFGDSGR